MWVFWRFYSARILSLFFTWTLWTRSFRRWHRPIVCRNWTSQWIARRILFFWTFKNSKWRNHSRRILMLAEPKAFIYLFVLIIIINLLISLSLDTLFNYSVRYIAWSRLFSFAYLWYRYNWCRWFISEVLIGLIKQPWRIHNSTLWRLLSSMTCLLCLTTCLNDGFDCFSRNERHLRWYTFPFSWLVQWMISAL